MLGYDDFRITTIDIDKFNSKITISFNQDVNKDDVNIKNITLTNKKTGDLIQYKLKCINNKIDVLLDNSPNPNNKYLLYIDNIKNVLDEKLETNLERTIEFKSSISSVVKIISPSNFQKINELNIQLIEENKNSNFINSYYIEISKDVGFFDVILKTTVTNKTSINLNIENKGQYYIRCRAQNEKDFGIWSDIVTFILDKNSKDINEDDMMPTFEEDLKIVSMPDNGETPKSFIIEFDGKIDKDTIKNLLIFRKEL